MSIKWCTMILLFSVWCYKVSLKGMNTNFALQLMVWCFYIQKCISSGNRSDKTILSLKCFHVMLVPSVQQNYNDVMFVEHENII